MPIKKFLMGFFQRLYLKMKKDQRLLFAVKVAEQFDNTNKKLQLVRDQILISLNLFNKSYSSQLVDNIRLKGRLDLLIFKISKKNYITNKNY